MFGVLSRLFNLQQSVSSGPSTHMRAHGSAAPSLIRRNTLLLFALIAAITLAVCFVQPVKAYAADAHAQTVRVGWYQSDMFQEGTSDDQVKSGYCYDYLQKVSDYTSWKYEYVYGDWPELMAKLQSGEIDFLAGVSPTEERKKTIAFPDSAMGTDQYYIYKHANDASISATDLTTLNGKKAGGIKDNRAALFTQQWIEDNGLDVEMVYFDSFEEQEAAFQRGDINLMTQTINNVLSLSGINIVSKVGEEPFYLAVAKGRTDLLSQLNAALTTLLFVDPFLLESLQYNNYGATLTSRTLTLDEENWIKAHPVVTVGYLESYLPYSGKDSQGKATGLMTDVLDAIIDALNLRGSLSVEYKGYATYEDMLSALEAGSVDTVFPVSGNLWELEKAGTDATSSVVDSGEVFVYKGTYDKSQVKTVAVYATNSLQVFYCQRVFPDAEQVVYSSMEDCLQAVLDGKVDGTVINSLRTELVTGTVKFRSLSYAVLDGTDSRCFGVRGDSTELLLLLNRGLRIIGTSYGLDNAYKYMGSLGSYGAADFLMDYFWWILAVCVVVVAVVVGLLLRNSDNKRKAAEASAAYASEVMTLNSELEERQAQLEEAAAEQEAHIEEVTALNTELEERQAQLEEAAAEQEAHIEEVSALNMELEEQKEALASARDAADAANAAKTSFLFSMSHDIRTPMNAIMGFRDLLEKHQDEPEKRADYLRKIEDSSAVLLSIINNVLEMARIEKGTVEIDETAWSAEQFNDSLYSVFADMMRQKNITFTREVKVTNHYVYCDPIKLREVFINILSNAYKYTDAGGTVRMTLEEVEGPLEGFAYYRTTISDTGIGMSEDFLPHLYDEFARESSTTDSQIEGTGLGMPIVKRLVDLMGGTIEVQSQKGVGSVFVVTFPHRIADRDSLVEHAGVEVDPRLFAGKRILLAEDNDLNAEIAMELLGEAGFVVERAEDGVVAVECLSSAPAGYYDVVLMDIQMPNMNGYDATRAIRQLEDAAKARVPILAMTANAFEEDKREALRAGMNDHLSKPVNVAEMMRALAGVLG